ncbi:MAG: hypothetical protein V4577_29100 [Bacteroidota bacterium]
MNKGVGPIVTISDKSNALKTSFLKLKLNFAHVFFFQSGGSGISVNFDIDPKEFLKFAKKDLEQSDKRGYINAITNAKRAIDCQTDLVLKLFGLNFDKDLPNAAKHFIEHNGTKQDANEKYNLKLIEALGIAPIMLISKVRRLRHQLEHYYQIPSKKDVKEAIELAELYITSARYRTAMAYEIIVTNNDEDPFEPSHCFNFNFSETDSSIDISIYEEADQQNFKFFNTEVEFYYFLKMAILYDDEDILSDCLKKLLVYIQHPQAKLKIDVEVY